MDISVFCLRNMFNGAQVRNASKTEHHSVLKYPDLKNYVERWSVDIVIFVKQSDFASSELNVHVYLLL